MIEDLEAIGAGMEVLADEPAESLVQRLLMAGGAIEGGLPDQILSTNTISEAVLRALLEVNRTVREPEGRIAWRTELFQRIRPAFALSPPMPFEGAAVVNISI